MPPKSCALRGALTILTLTRLDLGQRHKRIVGRWHALCFLATHHPPGSITGTDACCRRGVDNAWSLCHRFVLYRRSLGRRRLRRPIILCFCFYSVLRLSSASDQTTFPYRCINSNTGFSFPILYPFGVLFTSFPDLLAPSPNRAILSL